MVWSKNFHRGEAIQRFEAKSLSRATERKTLLTKKEQEQEQKQKEKYGVQYDLLTRLGYKDGEKEYTIKSFLSPDQRTKKELQ